MIGRLLRAWSDWLGIDWVTPLTDVGSCIEPAPGVAPLTEPATGLGPRPQDDPTHPTYWRIIDQKRRMP